MTRRTLIDYCKTAGCRENRLIEYERGRSRREDWLCFRHRHPEELLSESNREITKTLTVVQRGDPGGRHFFDGKIGMVSGPGFVAVAQDWPLGTRLHVAVRVECPAGLSPEEREEAQ